MTISTTSGSQHRFNMKLSPEYSRLWVATAARMAILVLLASVPASAASLELTNAPATGEPGKFAAEEIRREAVAKGMTLGDDAKATRIALTVRK